MKSAATCEAPAIYYYACVWCTEKSSDTFTEGEKLGHDYSPSYDRDADSHWRECVRIGCDARTEEASHQGGTATCETLASCSVCGTEYGSSVSHDFSEKTIDPDYLKSAATCEAPAVYYYACVWCEEKGPDTFVEGEKLGHSYSPSYDRNADSHWRECVRIGCDARTEEASHQGGTATCATPASCSVCGTEYGSSASHDYSEKIIAPDYLKSAATCEAPAIYYYACVWCTEKSSDTFTEGEKLGHDYSLSYERDADSHWRTCVRIGCDARTKEASHQGGTASCTEQRVCDICQIEYGDVNGHSYSLQIKNNSTCIKEATCTTEGLYYLSCTCGAIGEKTFHTPALDHAWSDAYYSTGDGHYQKCTRTGCTEQSPLSLHTGGTPTCTTLGKCRICDSPYGEYADHSYTEILATESYLASPATCESSTTYYYSCVCGRKGTTVFSAGEALGHKWSRSCSYSDDTHYYVCENGCGKRYGEAAHQMSDYKQTQAPTCSALGIKVSTCSDCDYTIEQHIEMLEHEWQYDQILLERLDASAYVIKIVDKCKNCTVYETITQSSPHSHENYIILPESEASCTEDGLTRGVVCGVDGCGEAWVAQETIPASGHNYVDGLCAKCGEAEEAVEEFDESTGLSYRRNSDGTYTVTGSGTRRDTTVQIPDTYKECRVTAIADNAFRGQSQIQTLAIGNNVTTIGSYAFADLTKISTVTIGNNVTSMGIGAFDGCTNLTRITFNAIRMDDLEGGAFNRAGNNSSSLELIIGTEVKYIPANLCASDEGNSIKKITFNNVSQCAAIGANAFYNCHKVQNINLPKSVKVVGNNAFQGCNSLIAVDYLGSDKEWDAISIGEGNSSLLDANRF